MGRTLLLAHMGPSSILLATANGNPSEPDGKVTCLSKGRKPGCQNCGVQFAFSRERDQSFDPRCGSLMRGEFALRCPDCRFPMRCSVIESFVFMLNKMAATNRNILWSFIRETIILRNP